MPNPCMYTSEEDFHADCMADRHDEFPTEDPEQANAICYSMWRERECDKTMAKAKSILKAGIVLSSSDRTARWIASTNAVDRAGDIVEQDWDLSDFWKNPVLMFNHRADAFPVGRVTGWETRGSKSFADTEAVPTGVSEDADKVWELVDLDIIRGVSVAFTSQDAQPRFNASGEYLGTRYRKNKLIELSIASIPMNPEAIRVARGIGMSDALIKKAFTPTWDDAAGVYAPKTGLVEARRFIESKRNKV